MTNIPGFDTVTNEHQRVYLAATAGQMPGIAYEKVVSHYDNWSSAYDKDLNSNTYRGPKIAADFCEILLTDKSASILDIGAGTGMVGEYLKERQYTNVDAMEPSKGMLDLAKEKNVYRNYFSEGISRTEKTSLPDGSYDVVLLAGAHGEGHIPSEGVNEFARLTKKGGYIIIITRKEFLDYVKEYVDRLVPMMDKLESDGIWKTVTRMDVQNYFTNKEGIIFIFQKN